MPKTVRNPLRHGRLRRKRFGYVALIGRPNSGKSTLLNRLLGAKVSIVSEKPQTTRHRIQGILNDPRGQVVFVDTPGIHKPGYELNRRMLMVVEEALLSVDLLLFILDASSRFGSGDRFVFDRVKQARRPTLLLLNKIDRISKSALLPIIDLYRKEYPFKAIIPVSALRGEQLDLMLEEVFRNLPAGDPQFDPELYTDRNERFLVSEIIREKVLDHVREELPYATAVVIDRYDESRREGDGLLHIDASVLVEKTSQQGIIIGQGARTIRTIGIEAREEIEKLVGCRVFLQLHARTKKDWRNDPHFLAALDIQE